MGTTWEYPQNLIAQEVTIDPNNQTTQKLWERAQNNLLYYLRWNNFQSNMTKVFDQLLQNEAFVDVTLACDGNSLKAHKVVLSACSPYFQTLLSQNPCQHPIIILRDVTWQQLRAIVDFMYKGEINIAQDQLGPLLMVAETLKIRGLTEITADQETTHTNQPSPVVVSQEVQQQSESNNETEIPRVKSRKRNSSTSETNCKPSINLATQNAQPVPIKIMQVSSKPSTVLQPLTTVPFVTFTDTSTYSEADPIKVEEPPVKQIKSGFSSSSGVGDFTPIRINNKAITWTQDQLQEAIQAVVTQKMRFTQASVAYGIPKGTLYDNILGKTKRMLVLDEAGLTDDEEKNVLDFCCDVTVSPYNRRTKKSLCSVLEFVQEMRRTRDPEFAFAGLAGYRWWWAFCKKHSIVSLYYENKTVTNTRKTDDFSMDSTI